jgi:hypothetical protein
MNGINFRVANDIAIFHMQSSGFPPEFAKVAAVAGIWLLSSTPEPIIAPAWCDTIACRKIPMALSL